MPGKSCITDIPDKTALGLQLSKTLILMIPFVSGAFVHPFSISYGKWVCSGARLH